MCFPSRPGVGRLAALDRAGAPTAGDSSAIILGRGWTAALPERDRATTTDVSRCELIEGPGAERLWQLTVEHSPVGMTLVSPDGRLRTANRALCSMLGYTEDELRGMLFQQLTHVDDLPGHQDLFDATLSGERASYRIVKRCMRADGSTLWGDLSVALVRDDDGEPLHLIGQIHDVTESRHHEQRLSEALDLIDRQRRRAQAILDSVDVGILLLDQHGHYEDWNRHHHVLLALSFPDGHRGRAGQLGDVFAADGTTVLGHHDMPSTRAVRGEEFDDYRIWIGADPLTRRALSVSARSVVDATGEHNGAVLAYSDITDLMRAVRSREDFLAAVSHELRTPLTSVVGHLELLVDRPDLDAGVADRLRVVRRNATRLHYLVADLLESAQQRDGHVALTRTTEDLAALLQDAAESAGPAAEAGGVTLATDVTGPVLAHVDRERVRQVFDNLVSNAVKYTERGGRVDLRLEVVDGEASVEVADTGIGIDPEDLDHVFTPFYRSQEARERVTPGVGLGLGIARAIVIAHRGRIEVTSTPGVGTTVRATLPVGAG
ncbi:MAG: phoR 2 [Nocardioides sp.]|nr:phoR 2 [Nocardioides sp.]